MENRYKTRTHQERYSILLVGKKELDELKKDLEDYGILCMQTLKGICPVLAVVI